MQNIQITGGMALVMVLMAAIVVWAVLGERNRGF